ncbi:MAG: S-methyl-5-thioribose-1-phosphate isomerase [Thermodesulfobacteriota bacterium]
MGFKTLEWKNGKLFLLDQTKLPAVKTYVSCTTAQEVAKAIKKMIVRGAPAIGVAAAFGFALGAKQIRSSRRSFFQREMEKIAQVLLQARPTAVNLRWAIDRQQKVLAQNISQGIEAVQTALVQEAQKILQEDVATNMEIGRQGQILIPDNSNILTHCNAGALATAGYGTALGVIRAAHAAGKRIHVFIDETRPFLQGARLTAWELKQDGIPCTLIADNMAGDLMQRGKIQLTIVGADRIAANGDVANKIGTYSLACLCHLHSLPFYVAAPLSSLDLSTPTGNQIPVEQRPAEELIYLYGQPLAPRGINVYNPAFDITPQKFIQALITEKGIIHRPLEKNLRKIFRFQ